jgi:SAM-dependent methyltransferase
MKKGKNTSPKIIYSKSGLQNGFRKWIMYSLLGSTRINLLKLIDFPVNENSIIVDFGCNIGYITRPLLLIAKNTIGIDVDPDKVRYAKKTNAQIEFICGDLCHLPLRPESIDLAVCASVFEHIENLNQALKEITYVLNKQGKLIAGYPIETKLLDFIIRSFWKSESQIWQQNESKKHKENLKNPIIHKHDFLEIRQNILEFFSPFNRRKIPSNCFPDLLSIYENVILLKKQNEIIVD